MARDYPHLLSRVFDTPLLIARTKLDVIIAVLAQRMGVGTDVPAQDLARVIEGTPEPAEPKQVPAPVGLGVIYLHGTLVNRGGIDAWSGMKSYEGIHAELAQLENNPKVHAIVLDVDSYGGEAAGCFDTARRIREADARKPVYAIVNANACSAAYALASAARKVYAIDDGLVGSIGVIATHVDQTKHNDQEGFKVVHFTAGARKADFSPHQEMPKAAADWLQSSIDETYGKFVDLVADHRGMSAKAVRGTQAAIYSSSEAKQAGLIDAVMTVREAFSSIFNEVSTMSTNKENGSQAGADKPAAGAETAATTTTTTATVVEHPTQTAEIVDLEKARAEANAEGRRQALTEATEIRGMCAAVGLDAKDTEALIAKGLRPDAAAREIFKLKAAKSAETTVDTSNGSATAVEGDESAVSLMVGAMKDLNAQAEARSKRA